MSNNTSPSKLFIHLSAESEDWPDFFNDQDLVFDSSGDGDNSFNVAAHVTFNSLLTEHDYHFNQSLLTTFTQSPSSPLNSSYKLAPSFDDTDNDLTSKILQMDSKQIVRMAKNFNDSKELQIQMQLDKRVRLKLYDLMVDPDEGQHFLAQLATDPNGTFIIQKMIDSELGFDSDIIRALACMKPEIAQNRHANRVILKLVRLLSPEKIRIMLSDHFAGHEFALVSNENSNNILQNIVHNYRPEVYIDFMKKLFDSVGLKLVVENKFGCRVVQKVFERVVHFRQEFHEPTTRKAASQLLDLMLDSVLKYAEHLAENEFANYIVQMVLRTETLQEERNYIIKYHISENILRLSNGKYSSHVIEVAMLHAEQPYLDAMFMEVLEGYERGSSGKTALHSMLFNQYGNYVAQTMLNIAIQVKMGERPGDHTWFDQIVKQVNQVQQKLGKYSSGSKILQAIKWVQSQSFVPPLNLIQPFQTFIFQSMPINN